MANYTFEGPLVPEESWLDDNSTLVCPACGCVVASSGRPGKEQHQRWHISVINSIRALAGIPPLN